MAEYSPKCTISHCKKNQIFTLFYGMEILRKDFPVNSVETDSTILPHLLRKLFQVKFTFPQKEPSTLTKYSQISTGIDAARKTITLLFFILHFV